MRLFAVLCLVATTRADQLGYSYQLGGHSNGDLSFTPGSNIISGVAGGNLGGSLGGSVSTLDGEVGNLGNGGVTGSSLVRNNGATYDAPSFSNSVELEKEFYTFSAPESEFDDGNVAQKVAGSIKKGLRVIFIKGPENNSLENAALSLAKHVAEQKTAIYVLNKQADISDLAHKLNVINQSNNNKPEVHFLKYRTPEDAANAQRIIQSQYNSLGGSSKAHNAGIAPVLNFASHAPERYDPAHAPRNSYLPSSVFRRV